MIRHHILLLATSKASNFVTQLVPWLRYRNVYQKGIFFASHRNRVKGLAAVKACTAWSMNVFCNVVESFTLATAMRYDLEGFPKKNVVRGRQAFILYYCGRNVVKKGVIFEFS